MPARKHIAVVGFSTASHVYPSLALIRELVAQGHRVSYAIGDRLADLVESTGAELVTHPTTLPPDDADWPTDLAAVMGTRLFLNEAIAVLPRPLERYRHDRPDLVLYDLGGIAGPVLGTRLGVPSVLMTPANVAWEGFEEEIAAELQALEDAPEVRSYHHAGNEWLRENGIDRDAWEWAADVQDVITLFRARCSRTRTTCPPAGRSSARASTRSGSPTGAGLRLPRATNACCWCRWGLCSTAASMYSARAWRPSRTPAGR